LRYIKLNMGYWGCGFPKQACIDWGRALTREIGYRLAESSLDLA
jgi:hypothetical protein